MARRMYDLNSGSEDIIVKDAKLVGTNGLTIIKDNDAVANYSVSIQSTEDGVDISAGDLIVLSLDISSETTRTTLPLRLTRHTTPNRPSAPIDGVIIYDITLKKCILYNGTDWVNLDGTVLS